MSPVRAFDPSLPFVPLRDGRLAIVDSVDYRIKLVSMKPAPWRTYWSVRSARSRSPTRSATAESRSGGWTQLGRTGGTREFSPLGGRAFPIPSGFQEQMTAARRTTIEQMHLRRGPIPVDRRSRAGLRGPPLGRTDGAPGGGGAHRHRHPGRPIPGHDSAGRPAHPGCVRPGRPHGLRGDPRPGLPHRSRGTAGSVLAAGDRELDPESLRETAPDLLSAELRVGAGAPNDV